MDQGIGTGSQALARRRGPSRPGRRSGHMSRKTTGRQLEQADEIPSGNEQQPTWKNDPGDPARHGRGMTRITPPAVPAEDPADSRDEPPGRPGGPTPQGEAMVATVPAGAGRL